MFGYAQDKELEHETLLEDEHFFKSPMVDGETPELRDDVKVIATIESYLKGLEYVVDDIVKQGGMSQELALEAANYSEDFKNTPIGYFTKDPTQTRLDVSLESLFNAIKDNFFKIMRAIREWIRKLIAWFTGVYKKVVSDKDYEASKQKLDIGEEKTTNAWEAIIRHISQTADAMDALNQEQSFKADFSKVANLKDLEKTADILNKYIEVNAPPVVNRIISQADPFLHDMVYMGPYVRLLKELSQEVRSITTQLNIKIKALEYVFLGEQMLNNSSPIRDTQQKDLSIANKPVIITLDRKTQTLNMALNSITRQRQRTMDGKLSEPIEFVHLLARFASSDRELDVTQMSREVFEAMRSLVGYENRIEIMESGDKKIIYGDDFRSGNNKMISDIRHALVNISNEINQFTILVRYMKMALDMFFYAQKDIVHYSDNLILNIMNGSNKTGIKLPDSFKKHAQKVQSDRRENYDRYKAFLAGQGS